MSLNYTTVATTALGFTVALAWNNGVSQALKSFYPPASPEAAARHTLIYAVVITIFVIFVVAAVNYVRRALHHRKAGAAPGLEGLDPQRGSPGPGSGGGPGTGMGPAGLAPIVRLWEPPH